MNPVLLIDFGSTYTKVTAVDAAGAKLLGGARSFTTVETDVREGLESALRELEKMTGSLDYRQRLACSSAAGGLRMVTSGLVPELTATAARLASLGAGAKVEKVFSYELTKEDVDEIARLKPDVFLLAGGVDGGNVKTILHNAHMLASCTAEFPILFAGNRSAAARCEEALAGREVYRCDNVMPRLDQLNIGPTQEKIRELFLRRIIRAKGLTEAGALLDNILMPTPSAVMKAMELLAKGHAGQAGFGDLIAVDIGGATTDVFSMADGRPKNDNTVLKGLPEPYAKRTVEGDMGMRYSAPGILEAVGADRLARLSGLPPEKVEELAAFVSLHTDILSGNPDVEALDHALACAAVETAVRRHAGAVERVYTPAGPVFVQSGKDLTDADKLVVTGGTVVHSRKAAEIAEFALYDPADPASLRPKKAAVFIDRKYILSAMGLLSGQYPGQALAIMKKELDECGAKE